MNKNRTHSFAHTYHNSFF